MTQRPDLFGACLPAVGVMDMLRFHQVHGRPILGRRLRFSATIPHNSRRCWPIRPITISSPTSYPATLITTADTDDRVVPGHSFKFAARLQECQQGKAPVLIRIETRAGHGAGKPTAKIIEEIADQWAFLVKNLDMKLDD